jgi:hypothetical protein
VLVIFHPHGQFVLLQTEVDDFSEENELIGRTDIRECESGTTKWSSGAG